MTVRERVSELVGVLLRVNVAVRVRVCVCVFVRVAVGDAVFDMVAVCVKFGVWLGVGVRVIDGVRVRDGVCVRESVRVSVANGCTIMFLQNVLLPDERFTVNCTKYVPIFVYWWVGCWSVLVRPSPKRQYHPVISEKVLRSKN